MEDDDNRSGEAETSIPVGASVSESQDGSLTMPDQKFELSDPELPKEITTISVPGEGASAERIYVVQDHTAVRVPSAPAPGGPWMGVEGHTAGVTTATAVDNLTVITREPDQPASSPMTSAEEAQPDAPDVGAPVGDDSPPPPRDDTPDTSWVLAGEGVSDLPRLSSFTTDLQRNDLADAIPRFDDDMTPLAMEVAEDTRRRIALAGRRFPHPPRTRVMTVANQKGGVGKTTTTVNLAAALAQSGLRVLVLDIDPQGNASTALGIDHHAEVPSVYDVLVEGMPLKEVVQDCPDVEGLTCAPATIDLAGAEIELVSLVARETRLRKAVDAYLDEQEQSGQPRLDYVLVDCPPSLGLLTVNAFVAAREVLIPIQCEYYALEGLSQLLKNVELIKGHLNPTLHVSTILLTMYDGRTRLSAQVADEVRAHFPAEVLKTTVPRSVRISEAPSHGQTVMTYDPASSGALSYLEAARELAEQVLGMSDDNGGDRRAEDGR